MSYNREQHEKNEQLIAKEMEGLSHQDIADVRRSCHDTWATDYEAKSIIKQKKEEISRRATPDEIDEVFKNFRV